MAHGSQGLLHLGIHPDKPPINKPTNKLGILILNPANLPVIPCYPHHNPLGRSFEGLFGFDVLFHGFLNSNLDGSAFVAPRKVQVRDREAIYQESAQPNIGVEGQVAELAGWRGLRFRLLLLYLGAGGRFGFGMFGWGCRFRVHDLSLGLYG
jgi:hypothetical protein